jgi:1-acyl-sn-glycerol-3-phosphate acyltransferase
VSPSRVRDALEVPSRDGPSTGALVPVPTAARDADDARRGDVDDWGRSERTRAVARRIFGPLYRNWFRVEWEGLEHLPTTGGALLVANHAGAVPMDAPVIMHGVEEEVGRPVYTLAENVLWSMPFVGTVFSRVGGVNAHPDNAYRLLHDDGQLALVFPEGTKATGKTYAERYQLRRFGRGGFVRTAMRAGVPIVPVAVLGAEEAMPIFAHVPALQRLTGLIYFPVNHAFPQFGLAAALMYMPAKFKIRFMDPVDLSRYGAEDAEDLALIQEIGEQVRTRIQLELDEMRASRRSVWFG